MTNHIKLGLTLFAMGSLAWFMPNTPIDPWGLFNLHKISVLIFSLALIQGIGLILPPYLGVKIGAILTGFSGGLISSTATTAALSKQSKESAEDNGSIGTLTLLAATGAMLIEGLVLTFIGTNEFHPQLLLIFLAPMLATAVLIFLQYKSYQHRTLNIENSKFKLLSLLKLSLFILVVLSLSKLLQNVFGQNGLYALTFAVSLFEIHGSIIANSQLHNIGTLEMRVLGHMLAISIAASYASKLFLIFTLGSAPLKHRALKSVGILSVALALGWVAFLFST